MSEDMTTKLAAFTPVAVDRDALLFAAGRASAQPSRVWKRLTCALLISQSITIGLWFRPRSESPADAAPSAATTPTTPENHPLPPIEPYSWLALSRDIAVDTPDTTFSPSPSRPPLLAYSRDFQP